MGSIIIDKHGQPHEIIHKAASFKGTHNMQKAKTLILLYSARDTTGRHMSAQRISQLTGVPVSYLYHRLTWWYQWRYINRKAYDPGLGNGKPHYVYCIDERGIHFVIDRIPPDRYKDYANEIRTHQGLKPQFDLSE